MKYPNFLKNDDVIGITALSGGCSSSLEALSNALYNFKDNRFNVITTNNVYGNDIVSSSKKVRLKELQEIIDKSISLLLIARGGYLLYEILDSIPFESIADKHIWVMGYSDPTSVLYILTTKYDLATIYGFNAKSYSDIPMFPYQINSLEILRGNLIKQSSFDSDSRSINGNFSSNGILIGGCLEVLKDLIGTRFDCTLDFIEKYKDYGIVWYFDIYDMKPVDVYLTFLQFKHVGWFKYSNTFLIGKVLIKQDESIMTYNDTVKALFGNIVIDTNIGHVKPCFTLINGSYINVEYKNNELSLNMKIL